MEANSFDGNTRIVFLLPQEDNSEDSRHDASRALNVVKPLFTSNGIMVGEATECEEGFGFPVCPESGEWDRTSIDAFTAGLHSLSALGFTVYTAIVERDTVDEAVENRPAVGAALVAGVVVVGAVAFGIKKLIGRDR